MIRTNDQIARVLTLVDELIAWASADADASGETGARSQQRDDRMRAGNLRKARTLIAASVKIVVVCLLLGGCRTFGGALDAYSASQGYYYPPPPAQAPTTTTCYRVINQIVCETR